MSKSAASAHPAPRWADSLNRKAFMKDLFREAWKATTRQYTRIVIPGVFAFLVFEVAQQSVHLTALWAGVFAFLSFCWLYFIVVSSQQGGR